MKKFNYYNKILNNIKKKTKLKNKNFYFFNKINNLFCFENFIPFFLLSLIFTGLNITLGALIFKIFPNSIILSSIFIVVIPLLFLFSFISFSLFKICFYFYKKYLLNFLFNKKESYLIKELNIFKHEEKNYNKILFFYFLKKIKNIDIITIYQEEILNFVKNSDNIDNNFFFSNHLKEYLIECFNKKYISKDKLITKTDYYIKKLNIEDKEIIKSTYLELKDLTELNESFSIQNLINSNQVVF